MVDPPKIGFEVEHGEIERRPLDFISTVAVVEELAHPLTVRGSLRLEVGVGGPVGVEGQHDLDEQVGVHRGIGGVGLGEPTAKVGGAVGGDAVALAVGTLAGFLAGEFDQSVTFEASEGGVDLAVPHGLEVPEPAVPGSLEVIAMAGFAFEEPEEGVCRAHPWSMPQCSSLPVYLYGILAGMAGIEARDVTKHFVRGDTVVAALGGVSLQVEPGEAVAVAGPSGAGKSTLLHLLGAMDKPTSGTVLVDDVDTSGLGERDLTVLRRRKLGFVFQFFHLLPSLSSVDNVAVPLLLDGTPVREARRAAEEVLRAVGLADRLDHRPSELSGGELQRAAIARALVSDPPIVLADEPTGNLDSTTGAEVMTVLLEATEGVGRSLVVVTHDPAVAERCGRMLTVRDGLLAEAALRS